MGVRFEGLSAAEYQIDAQQRSGGRSGASIVGAGFCQRIHRTRRRRHLQREQRAISNALPLSGHRFHGSRQPGPSENNMAQVAANDDTKQWSRKRRRIITALAVTHPTEFYDRFIQQRPHEAPPNRPMNVTSTDASGAIHELLGSPGCDCSDLAAVLSALPSVAGVHKMDGGRTLLLAVWSTVRHLKPEVVLETGVARGHTSAVILSALAANHKGHLWSIDLPLIDPEWEGGTGMAVPDTLRNRWTYVRGSSQRHMPRLLKRLGDLDIFVHDSSHSLPRHG